MASACTSVALLGVKAESVREKERMRLTGAAALAALLTPSAPPRSRSNTCVSAATITCGSGGGYWWNVRWGGGASGPGQPPGRAACGARR